VNAGHRGLDRVLLEVGTEQCDDLVISQCCSHPS
jgi:hypothetical protein